MTLDRETSAHYDAIIIGAGIGGLLTAAQVSRMEKKVVVLERSKYVGGRFTSVSRDGFQLSTGAVHMIPFGPQGVFARLLRRIEPRCQIDGSGFMASFHADGRHVLWDKSWDVLAVFTPRETATHGDSVQDEVVAGLARQGSDVTQLPVKGLHVVGDGCKAAGYPMVEGVAKQVENVVEAIAACA